MDVLRGFALFGILYAPMIMWFAAPCRRELMTHFRDIFSGVAFGVYGVLVMAKFFSIFSFLFGLSFTSRSTAWPSEGDNVALRFGWRLALLGVVGITHHALWRGDILGISCPSASC